MSYKRLQEAYEYIRENFFHRWDRNEQWVVRLIPMLPACGRCDEKKEIQLRYVPDDEDSLHLLLIHEICHAFDLGHGKKWFARMLKAADDAKNIERNKLAGMLQMEIDEYKKPNLPTGKAKEIYGSIEDVVLDSPGASYKDVIKFVANDLGMYPEELEDSFKLCKRVYDKAVKE